MVMQTNYNKFIAICIVNGALLTLSVNIQVNTSSPSNSLSNSELLTQNIDSIQKRPSLTDSIVNGGFMNGDEFKHNRGSYSSGSPEKDTDEILRQFEAQRSISQNGLSKLSKMLSPRCSNGLVSINNKLYIIGGYDRGECLTKCETYDPIENKFNNFDSMTNRRGRSATIYVEKFNSIFVFGGSDGHQELNSFEKYDFNLNKWSSIKFDAIFDCVNVGIIADDDFVYLVGIHDNKTNMPIHCLKYDPAANVFQCISDLNSGN